MKACAKKFEAYLDSKNYNYHVYADDSEKAVIGFPYSGREVKCFFTGDDGEYLSLYMVYENVSEDKMVQALVACNELNAKFKWVTYYIDDDRDILLHDDAILTKDNAAAEAMELLVRMVDICDKGKPVIMKALYA
ncbi:MAG: YbjN domain-containing protein [Clostridia bacterium]|nr:YbjN domain-containing protein [Clostridia bacterium]MBQ4624387.1 YbjN domain-containing protein [Clostridia bacterium]